MTFYSGDRHADVHFDDMHWELYDMTEFIALSDELAAADSAEKAEELYDRLLNEYVRLRTYSALAWIDFYASGGQDETLADACQKLDEMVVDAGDRLFSASGKALKGDAAAAFAAYLGEELAAELAEYEDLTDRERELLARETELTLRYNELIEQDDSDLTGLNKQLGEIFLELVGIRNELAGSSGYDTYAEYAYKEIYGYYHDHGVKLVIHHSDSYAANLVPAMIEMGIDVWQGCFSTNNIPELIAKYGGQITFMGGIENRLVDFEGWTKENNREVIRRTIEECGNKYFIPCIAQGGPGSVYPGVYESMCDEIDAYNEEKFGFTPEEQAAQRLPQKKIF